MPPSSNVSPLVITNGETFDEGGIETYQLILNR